jgi:hypothetical protein
MTLGGSSFLQVVPCGGQRFGGDCSGGLGLGGIADPPLSSLQKGSKKQLSKILKTGNKKKTHPPWIHHLREEIFLAGLQGGASG